MGSRKRIILFLLAFFSILFLVVNPLPENQYSPTSDEGYYFHYASLISQKGMNAFPELIDWYDASEEALKHPAPTRVGYLLPLAFWFKITQPTYSAIGSFSLLCFILFLLFSFYFCKKYFNIDMASLLTLLLSSSPLMMAMSRRALPDSTINCIWGIVIWLFLDFLHGKKKITYAVFVIVFSMAILIKESSIVLLPFFIIAILSYQRLSGDKLKASYLWGTVAYPLIISFALYFMILGGMGNVIKSSQAIWSTHFNPHHSNPYAIYFSAGPWFRYLVDFMLLIPITTLLFIGFFFHILMKREGEWKIMYFWLYFVVVFGILSSMAHTKVIRFAINLEMVISLFSVFALYEIFKHQDNETRNRRVFIAAILIFFVNFLSFINIFYLTGLLDPISYHLFVLRKFIPPMH